jgi:hypothetical protein
MFHRLSRLLKEEEEVTNISIEGGRESIVWRNKRRKMMMKKGMILNKKEMMRMGSV